MICPDDTQTMTIPGIPELPVKPVKTTQADRMQRMGYEGPKDRPRCESCLHSAFFYLNADSLAEVTLLRCQLGDFPVLRGGICTDWTA